MLAILGLPKKTPFPFVVGKTKSSTLEVIQGFIDYKHGLMIDSYFWSLLTSLVDFSQ